MILVYVYYQEKKSQITSSSFTLQGRGDKPYPLGMYHKYLPELVANVEFAIFMVRPASHDRGLSIGTNFKYRHVISKVALSL